MSTNKGDDKKSLISIADQSLGFVQSNHDNDKKVDNKTSKKDDNKYKQVDVGKQEKKTPKEMIEIMIKN